MEKSFTLWRESKNLEEIENVSDDDTQDTKCDKRIFIHDSDGESESDIITSSDNNLFVPDSDVPESDESSSAPVKSTYSNSNQKVVPDSDEEISSDKVDTNHSHSSFRSGIKKTQRESINDSHYYYNSSIKNSTPKFSDSEDSSPDIISSAKRNHKKLLISSDEENSTELNKNFNISDVFSGEENGNLTSINKADSIIKDHNSTNSITNNYIISDSEEESSSKDKKLLEACKPLTTIDLTLPIRDDHNKEESPSQVKPVLETSKTKPLSTIDLTLPIRDDQSGSIIKHNGVITVSSDSDEVEAHEEQLNAKLSNINISKHNVKSMIGGKKDVNTEAFHKNSENDYLSRLEHFKAEQARLEVEVKEVLRKRDITQSTLKTANLSVLPDKGFRPQANLKKYESQLRELRYRQNTLSNEIIRLQIMANSTRVSNPIQPQPPLPSNKMFKLPKTTTDINAMGARAMETHRTQQALTVDALRALHNSLKNCPSEDILSSDPEGLKVELMPHQKYALSWLLWREKEKPSGGILADDMGLGKTLTMISLILKSNEQKQEHDSQSDESENDESPSGSNWLSSHRAKPIPGKTLVVCPASLLGQWEGEVQRRLRRGTIDVLLHHGQNREKKTRRLAKPDIVITTYNIVSRDAQKPESPIFQIKWERVILDEAHQIRNHKTQTAQAVFQLKAISRWVLTGTPVHNKELDLYALLKFLRCKPFDDINVWKTWVDNRDAAGQQRMNTIIKSVMLRRTKKGLQEIGELRGLPDKKLSTVFVRMDKEEWIVYEKLLNFSKTLFARFLHQKAEKENALQGIPLNSKNLKYVEDPFKNHPELARLHRQMKEISDVKSHHILVLILRLRQFCCHPYLIQSMLEKDDISNVGIEDSDGLDIDLMDKMTRMSIVNQNQEKEDVDTTTMTAMDKDNPVFSKDRASSKLRKVLETMDEILTGKDKLLVVSQWVSHLHLLHEVLKEKQIKCLILTGKVPVKDRAEIVEKFNRKDHGPKVLLLSLTAGGVGLNLVGANHLLLLDIHWNPQLENQAQDRIYRVGQEKNVQIYKFITSETIEESVLKLQEAKLDKANSVLTGSKQSSKLTMDDLKALFKIS